MAPASGAALPGGGFVKRPDRIGRFVGAVPRFTAGLLLMPPFLLTGHLLFKAVLTLCFAVTAVLSGKKIRWLYFLYLGSSVTFFHLLTPFGRVLAEIGPLSVTAGALSGGISRSLTLIGMVFLSVSAVRPELQMPGRFGRMTALTFRYFDVIIEGRKRLTGRNFLSSLDQLLMNRFDPRRESLLPEAQTPAVQTQSGWTAALALCLTVWFVWFLLRS